MLDVHPPHHATNTWRDFFIHIETIVVGLLIAVGLEQTVEFFHRRHQRLALLESPHRIHGAASHCGSPSSHVPLSSGRPPRPASPVSHPWRTAYEPTKKARPSMDAMVGAVILSSEETAINTVSAATTITGADGWVVEAIPHNQLQDFPRKY